MSDKRYSIGRELTEFGDYLSGSDEFNNPTGAGEWKEVAGFSIGMMTGNKEVVEEAQEYMNQVRDLVVNNFDYAITAVSLFRDIFMFLPNFMNAVINYIADLVYNALDGFLRLGVHILYVPPNLTDWGENGLPTTSLPEQAENVYKKMYDTSDPNLPYNKPYQKNLADEIIGEGDKVMNLYEKYYLNQSPDVTNRLGGEKKYLKSDYIDFKTSIENLSQPNGFYDAVFLYFSVDYNSNMSQIISFIESIASISNFFQFESMLTMYDDLDNTLLKKKVKKVKLLTNMKLDGIELSTRNANDTEYINKDSYTIKNFPKDKKLEDYYIVPANPILNMPAIRKDKVLQNLNDQSTKANEMVKTLAASFNEMSDIYTELYQFNLNDDKFYYKYVQDIKDLKSEIIYDSFKYEIQEYLSKLNPFYIDEFYEQLLLFSSLQTLSEYGEDSSFYESTKYNSVKNFADKLKNYIQLYTQTLSIDEDPSIYFNDLYIMGEEIRNTGEALINEYRTLSDIFTITDPTLSLEGRYQKLLDLESDIEEIKKKISVKTREQIRENLSEEFEKIDEKARQIELLSEKSSSIDNVNDGANISYFHKYYPLVNQVSLYKNLVQKSFNITEVDAQNYVYEFTLRYEPNGPYLKTDKIQPGMYVQIVKKNGTSYDVIGDGIVITDELSTLSEGGEGNWILSNFSDYIPGLTPTIKTLQEKVLQFKSTLEPNTSFFDSLIESLKTIKERVLELIDIIDALITILNLSVEFQGKIYGKYCREVGLEGYDKLASDLTNTDDYQKPAKKSFRPSNLSTVSNLLSLIRQIDPDEADAIKDEINNLFAQTTNHDERKNELTNNSQISLVPDRIAEKDAAKILGDQIQSQIDNITKTPLDILDLGSTLYTNITSTGIVSSETAEANEKDRKIKYYKALIYAEIAKQEPYLSNEYGFSLVFLSYLPKSIGFYPVRWLAEVCKLVDEDGNSIDEPGLQPLDSDVIRALSPNLSTQDLRNILETQSKDENPSIAIKADPDAFSISFIPFRTTESFELNNSQVTALASDTNYFNGGKVGGDYKFTIKGQLNNNYLHGVQSNDVLVLPRYSVGITNKFTYRYEFELGVEYNIGNYDNDIIPEINKINVYIGLLYKDQANNITRATQLNDSDNEVFKFGRRKKRKFIAELELNQNESSRIKPYILIGYENGDFYMERLTFTITNSEIYFYRIK